MPTTPEKKTGPSAPRSGAQGAAYSSEQLAAGVGGTILLHILLLAILWQSDFGRRHGGAEEPSSVFDIELAPAEPEEDPEPVFAQTNPDVPHNAPDETNRFGARDQQAAQEELPEELDPGSRSLH